MQSVPAESEPVAAAAMAVSAVAPQRLSKRERKAARKLMMQSAMAGAGASVGDTPLVFQSTPEAGRLAGGLERVGAGGRYPKFTKRGPGSWFRRDRDTQRTLAGNTAQQTARAGQSMFRRRLGAGAKAGRSYLLLHWLAWSLRITAGLLVPGAVKVMLVVFDATGSPVVAALSLVTGVAVCAMLLTVGEIAAATRNLLRCATA